MQRLYREKRSGGAHAASGNENKVKAPAKPKAPMPSSGPAQGTETVYSTGVQTPSPTPQQRTMLNITAVGRLGKDPELRTTQIRPGDHQLHPCQKRLPNRC